MQPKISLVKYLPFSSPSWLSYPVDLSIALPTCSLSPWASPLLRANPDVVAAATKLDAKTGEMVSVFNMAPDQVTQFFSYAHFLTANLLPVTLGNIVGGAIFVGGIYWLIYLKK